MKIVKLLILVLCISYITGFLSVPIKTSAVEYEWEEEKIYEWKSEEEYRITYFASDQSFKQQSFKKSYSLFRLKKYYEENKSFEIEQSDGFDTWKTTMGPIDSYDGIHSSLIRYQFVFSEDEIPGQNETTKETFQFFSDITFRPPTLDFFVYPDWPEVNKRFLNYLVNETFHGNFFGNLTSFNINGKGSINEAQETFNNERHDWSGEINADTVYGFFADFDKFFLASKARWKWTLRYSEGGILEERREEVEITSPHHQYYYRFLITQSENENDLIPQISGVPGLETVSSIFSLGILTIIIIKKKGGRK